jgi:hypothetical protein
MLTTTGSAQGLQIQKLKRHRRPYCAHSPPSEAVAGRRPRGSRRIDPAPRRAHHSHAMSWANDLTPSSESHKSGGGGEWDDEVDGYEVRRAAGAGDYLAREEGGWPGAARAREQPAGVAPARAAPVDAGAPGGGVGAGGGMISPVGPCIAFARHVIGCRLSQETRVRSAFGDVTSSIRQAVLTGRGRDVRWDLRGDQAGTTARLRLRCRSRCRSRSPHDC